MLKKISNNTKKAATRLDTNTIVKKLKAIKSEFNLTRKYINDLRVILHKELNRELFIKFEGDDLRELVDDMLVHFRKE